MIISILKVIVNKYKVTKKNQYILPVVMSAAGCSKENFNMKMAIPVFCIPDSTVMDIISCLDERTKNDSKNPRK